MAIGYGTTSGPGASTHSVLSRVRLQAQQKRELAAREKAMKRELAWNVGKGALKFDKALRDWQLAKIAKQDLKFTEFMKNPTASGAYMKKATNMVTSGNANMPKAFSLKRDMANYGKKVRAFGIGQKVKVRVMLKLKMIQY